MTFSALMRISFLSGGPSPFPTTFLYFSIIIYNNIFHPSFAKWCSTFHAPKHITNSSNFSRRIAFILRVCSRHFFTIKPILPIMRPRVMSNALYFTDSLPSLALFQNLLSALLPKQASKNLPFKHLCIVLIPSHQFSHS